jgi:hypothetical protein
MSKKNRVRKSVNNTQLMLAGDVLAELNPRDLLGDGTYKNIDGSAGPCVRCNRRISNNAMYHKRRGLIIGLECDKFVREIETSVPHADVALVAKHQFRLRMRELTLAGMKKKGLIKDKSDSVSRVSSLSQNDVELLISMG